MNSTVRLQLIIPVEVDTAFRVEAARQRTSISALAAEAFQQYLASKASEDTDSTRPPLVSDDTDGALSFAPAVA